MLLVTFFGIKRCKQIELYSTQMVWCFNKKEDFITIDFTIKNVIINTGFYHCNQFFF